MVFFDLLLPPTPPPPSPNTHPTLQHEDFITALFVNYLTTVLPRAAAAHTLLQPVGPQQALPLPATTTERIQIFVKKNETEQDPICLPRIRPTPLFVCFQFAVKQNRPVPTFTHEWRA